VTEAINPVRLSGLHGVARVEGASRARRGRNA
jgi:hypothetical protein